MVDIVRILFRGSTLRLERESLLAASGLDDDDGALSAPEMSLTRKTRGECFWVAKDVHSQLLPRSSVPKIMASPNPANRPLFYYEMEFCSTPASRSVGLITVCVHSG